jgi:hypothetical protein
VDVRHFVGQIKRLLFLPALLSLLALVPERAAEADLICRSPGGIGGFAREFRAAERQVGPTTRNRDQIHIYITVRDGNLYTHSNFISTMQIEDHGEHVAPNTVPTKLLIEDKFVDIPSVVQNIIGDEDFTFKDYRATEKSLTFHVEHSVFGDLRWKRLGFGESSIAIIDSDGTLWKTAHILLAGRKELLIKFRSHLYVRPEHAPVMANTTASPIAGEDRGVMVSAAHMEAVAGWAAG